MISLSSQWPWVAFVVFVLAMLALDLGVFHRKAHVIRTREALLWSAVWVSLALAFCGLLFLFWDRIPHESAYNNREAAMAFLTGYVVEKALSVDNIFVILMLFTFFGIPAKFQHRVLFWGILGALVMRCVMILAGVALIEAFEWTIYLFGLILIAAAVKMLALQDKEIDPEKNPILRLFRRLVPVTPELHDQKFFVRLDGRLWATPLFVVLLMVEVTDLVFAVDSIPAVIAISRDPFIVFTSNVFAILGLRALYFAVAGLMGMFAYLAYALSAILAFVGFKMLLHGVIKVPVETSLGIIIGLLCIAVVASIFKKDASGAHGAGVSGPLAISSGAVEAPNPEPEPERQDAHEAEPRS